jgi:hypothetical protein
MQLSLLSNVGLLGFWHSAILRAQNFAHSRAESGIWRRSLTLGENCAEFVTTQLAV